MSCLFTVFYIFLMYRAGSVGVGDNLQLNVAVGGLTNECWVSDGACNDNGFCNLNEPNSLCSCFNGFEGTSCEYNVGSISCSQMDCGFSGIQGECITSVSSEGTCACYTGWSGASCATIVKDVDYCEGISCNNQGLCVLDVSSETMYSCECFAGWGGTDCGEELDECNQYFLLDMFSRLVTTSGDLDSALECGYIKPAIFSSLTPSKADPWMYAPCICISMIEKFATKDYNTLESTCMMDKYRHLPFMEQVQSYCPACTELQDDIMEEVITTKSAACYHFIYQRTTMALYWRSIWKCNCVLDVGVESTTETILNCPFTQHNSVDDYISYENCGASKVCDWESMYTYFEVEYSKINLEGSVACKNWMEDWIFTVPGEQRFEDMSDTFCPCLDYLRGTGYEDESILDCIPITFHQLSMVDSYDQICYDGKVANTECLNYISYASIRLANTNYTAASMCWGAVDMASGIDSLSDNLLTVLCDCTVPLKDADYYYGETTIYALECLHLVYDDFDISECPNYNANDTNNYLDTETSVSITDSFDTLSLSSESAWKATAITEISVSAILIATAFFLQRRKSKLNL